MKNIFKIASLLAAAVVLFACEKVEADAELRLVSDKDVIQANGEDAATFKVMYGNKDVTASATIYTDTHEEAQLVDFKFATTSTGDYRFYADYGSLSTYDKNDADCFYVVKAINVAVPETVEDPEPQNTSFVHRAFLTQYTGTGCGFCPLMIKVLRELMADKTIPEKAVLAAVHSYGAGDPAYIAAPKVANYPYLTVDLVQGFSSEQGADVLRGYVEQYISTPAQAGISVSSKYYEQESVLVVKVAVKAAVDGIFNVGAWLLEDDIFGQQSDYKNVGDESYSLHENCVRIADSKYSSTWFGHLLGEMNAGDVAEKTFVMKVKPDWKVENLHLSVFASYGQADGKGMVYKVANAVDVPINAVAPFEYAK